MTTVITAPGVYEIPEADYHADPVPEGSVSSTGARKLIEAPALFRWYREHPDLTTRALDLGKAAHKMILGVGPDIVEVKAEDWRTKAAKDQRDEAHARGAVPLLTRDVLTIVGMAEALLAHDAAAALLMKGYGKPEQSLFWRDARTGVMCRARLDWLPFERAGRLIIPDYKSGRSAKPALFANAVREYGYHQQGAWYRDGAVALGLHPDPAFVFIVQEKEPPYLITIVELDLAYRKIAAALNRQALDTYVECTASGQWPGYATEVEFVHPPVWYEREHEDML